MKILVPAKRVVDPGVAIRVTPDGSGVESANLKSAMNPFDEVAVEEALRLKEKGVADEIVVVSIGPAKAEDTIRQALAMGADRGLLIEAEQPLEPLAVAKLLKAVVAEEAPDLVIMGKQAIDDDSSQTGQMLAALLGWGQATFASSLTLDGGCVVVSCVVVVGLLSVAVPLPCIVTTDLRRNEPRYASLPNIMKARKKPLDKRPLDSFGVDAAPRLTVLRTDPPAVRTAGVKVGSVGELVERLAEAGVL